MNTKLILLLPVFLLIYCSVATAQSGNEKLYPHLISDSIARHCDKHAPVPPVIKDVVLKGQVAFAEKSGIYSYQYSLKNGGQSTGCLWWLEIDIKTPENTIKLSDYGLKDYPQYVHKESADDPEIPPMIPVAFPDLPRKKLPTVGEVTIWNAGTTVYGAAHWASALEQYIPPGEETSGYVMTTHGLPGIRDFKAKPRYIVKDNDIYDMGVSEDEYIMNAWEHTNAFYENIAYHGKTVGPTAPPKDLNYQDFLDSIIAMKREAYALGWITNEGVEKSLDAKLGGIKKKLLSGGFVPARKMLDAFVNEVEAQGCESYDNCPKGKHLKPEAYALLKYNALYLIEHLK